MIIYIVSILEAIIQLSMMIMTGVYFIFSNTIMASLRPVASGAEVMVELNKIILNPLFLAIFWVSGMGALYFAFFADGLLAISGAVFLVGTTLVTMVRNVPLNNALKNAGSNRQVVWRRYLTKWVFWNHVRCVMAIIAGLLLVI